MYALNREKVIGSLEHLQISSMNGNNERYNSILDRGHNYSSSDSISSIFLPENDPDVA